MSRDNPQQAPFLQRPLLRYQCCPNKTCLAFPSLHKYSPTKSLTKHNRRDQSTTKSCHLSKTLLAARMRATTFFAAAAALAGSVAASPINKRDIAYVTEYSYVTAYVYTTVAAGSPEATPVSVAPKKEAVAVAVSTPTPSPIVITSEAPAPAPVSAAPAPAPEVESSSSAPSSSASLSSGSVSHVPGLSSYAQTVLLHHNAHRANHTAPPLLWSSDLENSAGQVAATCNYEHQM